ncbi:MAG TPA: sulfite exporter TauE/SafE family protein [bacterium]|nr:sulfite exporter TauE/SafE family protein [bacterium]
MFLTLFVVSLLGGFMSGLLGLGGAVVMIPLMLTVPPFLGVGDLSMKTVSGLSMIQVLFSSLSGLVIHKKNKFIHFESLLFIGIPIGFSAFAGSYLSKHINNIFLMYVFVILVFIAFVMFAMDKRFKKNNEPLNEIKINRFVSVFAGLVTGAFTGMIGVGGGFVLIPFMAYILKIPFKATIGTSLGIIFIGAVAGSIGKIVSFQVEFALVLPVIIGSLLAAQFGARVNKKTPPDRLRHILMVVVILSMIQVIYKIIEAG